MKDLERPIPKFPKGGTVVNSDEEVIIRSGETETIEDKINDLFGKYHETLDDGMNVIRLDGDKWHPLIHDIVKLFM